MSRILDTDFDDPVQLVFNEKLKYEFEINWANNMLDLQRTHNLPLRDENVRKVSVGQWKAFVNNVIRDEAFTRLRIHCANNRKTCHLHYESFIERESTKKNLNQIWLGFYLKAERECFISKLTSNRNITLMFDVPFTKGR